uniref:Inositol hexakisphosphate and diphosphoinositol-pentakisphosphate kinase n=1 Tax=Panagrolaimus sp. JU765 TaxID=591449 RepID=A0AC34QRI8_9BILA
MPKSEDSKKDEKHSRNATSAPNSDPKSTSPHPGRRVGTKSETAPNGMKKIVIGVCAMERKANSKPMKAIMSKILEYYNDWLSFVIFPEDVIMEEPVEKWPLCDCLISFHATDFPLSKAIEYERLRRPYVINDLHRQYDLLDRRKVFRALARAGIPHPRHCVLVRDQEGNVEGAVNETADSLEVNGMVFNKPFVEKPISAEDHNVYIYFPVSVGGGSQRLFRKINDRSSRYSPFSNVRTEGSYIYEEFIPADGTDVKVYAVGPFYAHAEARKAPGLDGKVDRDSDGKEVRYPVILSAKEKMIARRVVCAFGQTVCGFDLLRANGMSYVCDVNGFSFVKTSTKYYEDTAKILGNTILRRLATCLSIPWQIPIQDELSDEPALVSTVSGKMMELRCVIAVIRHGDRTPKQKMKLLVNDDRFFELFHKYDGKEKQEIKMKKPNQLMEVLELCRQMLHELLQRRSDLLEELSELHLKSDDAKEVERKLDKVDEEIKKWDQMRTVLEMYGHFSGINRKVQLKYLKPKPDSSDEIRQKPALLLIIKWGGELTTAGVLQAEKLGKLFRTLYPGIRRTDGKECPEDTQGLGFLRLHSTYRHDLKIYSSDEGRVQMTAAAFARGLLALEGELTPILMQMVKSSNTDGLLNNDYNARQYQSDLKSFLHSALQVDRDFTPEDYAALNPSNLKAIANAMEFIKNPYKMCHEIAGYVQRMVEIIRWHKLNSPSKTLYLNESWNLAEARWAKELRDFRKAKKEADGSTVVDFDISKIPDIYDNIKYDLEHNPELGINNEAEFERMYMCVKSFADIVVPQEYGISEESKTMIAQKPEDKKWQRALNFLSSVTEFNYMTQIVLMVYEDSRSDSNKVGLDRFHIELLFSPGLYPCFQTEKERIYENRFNTRKTNNNKHVQKSNSSGKNSDASDKDQPSEEPSRKESLSGSSKAALEGFVNHRSKSTDFPARKSPHPKSRVVSPRIQPQTNTWLSTPQSKSKEELDDDKSDVLSTGEETTSEVTPDGQRESDDDLVGHSVNLVVLGEVDGDLEDQLARRHSPHRKRHATGDGQNDTSTEKLENPAIFVEQKAFQGPVMKSMSDISCNYRPRSSSVDADEDERPQSRQIKNLLSPDDFDESQATVGSGRGKWAKDLVTETKLAMGRPIGPEIIENREYESRRPYASEVFARGDVIVMKRSESNDGPVMPTAASTATITASPSSGGVDEQTLTNSRRSRFPYRFKHHTVNLLTGKSGVENRLISTDVLMGKFMDKEKKKSLNNSAVLSTAVIARSSSAPRLQTFTAEEEIPVNEIRRFWPPLRSLETMHDNIRYKQLDEFFDKILSRSTPLPSPPKTPVQRSLQELQMSLDKRMKEQIARLKLMDS